MIIPAICFVGGLVAMGRTKPQTNVRKLPCFGPRTGIVYAVEDMPEIGVVVVRMPGGRAVAQFQRLSIREPGKPGLVYQHGQGDPKLLELIRRDFGVEPKRPVVVPSETRPISEQEKRYYRESLVYRAPETLGATDKDIIERARAFEALHGPIPHPAGPSPASPASPATSPSRSPLPSKARTSGKTTP